MSVFRNGGGAGSYGDLGVVKRDGVMTITLRRPEVYNCYRTETLQELIRAFQEASWDDTIGVIVYTGEGHRAFCTGGDVAEYSKDYTERPRDYWKYMSLFRGYLEAILRCGKPVVARINGMAVGGGNESQLACDLAVIAEHAYVGQVGTSVGSVACGGATQWLPQIVGDRRAREMLMLNPRIPARQALEWGLVNAVAPSVTREGKFLEGPTEEQIRLAQAGKEGYAIDLRKLDEKVAEYCRGLLEKFPECLRYTKAQVNHDKEAVWNATVPHAQEWLSLHFATPEPREGMGAFVEKRKVDYAGIRRRWAKDGSPEFVWGAYTRTCGACGVKQMPSEFRFCGMCGHDLPTQT